MLKAIKVRLYPSREQTAYINRQLGCSRLVYNSLLAWRKTFYEEGRRSPSSAEQSAFMRQLKEEKPFLREVHSKALQQAAIDLGKAFTNFFNGLKKGQHVGFPRFKSKKEHDDSCRFPCDAFIGVKGNRISFTKALSDIHFKCSRRDERYLNKRQAFVKSSTLRRTPSGRYYASILVEYDEEPKPKRILTQDELKTKAVGVDVGVKHFAVTSDGEFYDMPSLKRLEKAVRKYQRQLAKTEKDSKHHERIRILLARKQEKIRNIREAFRRSVVKALLEENDLVCVEDLNVRGMLKNHKLAHAIQSQGFGLFFTELAYKSAWEGKTVVEVGRFYASSKLCSHCGYKYENLTLDVREWTCPHCGTHHDRDGNAAANILVEGVRLYKDIVGLSSPEVTGGDCPTVDDRRALRDLRSSGEDEPSNECHFTVFQ